MRQVARVLSTYTADVSGVCSALYEMGGMVIMHDASGCNSTYNTHDEPRWYDMPSMVYVSGLSELEAVMGDDDKLIRDIERAAGELHPRFVAIAGSPIPMMMGTDFKGISRILERKLGIPVFGFATNGTHSYLSGAGMALAEAARRFCDREAKATPSASGKPSVNLLGVTPLDFSVVGNVEALRQSFESRGYEVRSCWAMGSSFEELCQAGQAQVNVVVSVTGVEAAKALAEMFGTPWVAGIPVGRKLTRAVMEAVDRAAATGENQMAGAKWLERPEQTGQLKRPAQPGNIVLAEAEQNAPAAERPTETAPVYIIGEWLWGTSLAYSLTEEYGCRNVKAICPLESEELFADRLMAGGRPLAAGMLEEARRLTLFLEEEDQIEEQVKDAALVIADPLYRRILPRDRKPAFIDFPHEGYSGRLYRNGIPVFIGEAWNHWIEQAWPEEVSGGQPIKSSD